MASGTVSMCSNIAGFSCRIPDSSPSTSSRRSICSVSWQTAPHFRQIASCPGCGDWGSIPGASTLTVSVSSPQAGQWLLRDAVVRFMPSVLPHRPGLLLDRIVRWLDWKPEDHLSVASDEREILREQLLDAI